MVREGSAPNFCPPTEEGVTITLQDERETRSSWSFSASFCTTAAATAFSSPVDEDSPACSSGEVVLLEVTELDEDGQPSAFELVYDEAVAREVYEDFKTPRETSTSSRRASNALRVFCVPWLNVMCV